MRLAVRSTTNHGELGPSDLHTKAFARWKYVEMTVGMYEDAVPRCDRECIGILEHSVNPQSSRSLRKDHRTTYHHSYYIR